MKSPTRPQGDKSDAVTETSGSEQDAVALLKADHRKVEELFKQYESADDPEKARLAAEVCKELIVHTLLEEELFYPACREKKVEDGALNEAQVEHDSAKVLIADVMAGKTGDEYYEAKVKVLSEYIKLHVGEEEDQSEGIFAKALTAGVDMSALGEKILARKPELLQQIESPEFNPPMPRSLNVQTNRTQSQERMAMPRYSQEPERDERGRFMSDDDHRGNRGSRYRDDDRDDRRASSNGERPRNESGQFMRDDDHDRGRGYSSGNGDNRRSSGDRDRDENGRFISHDERGGMYASRSRYDDDNRGSGQYRERDDNGRFASHDDRGRDARGHDARGDDRGRDDRGRDARGDDRGRDDRGRDDRGRDARGDDRSRNDRGYESRGDDDRGRDDRGRDNRSYDDRDDRGRDSRGRDGDHDDGRGWYGDSRGHAEAARRGWESRQSGRYADDDDRRGNGSNSRHDDDDRGRHSGWFGDPEGHAEASRRGWRNR